MAKNKSKKDEKQKDKKVIKVEIDQSKLMKSIIFGVIIIAIIVAFVIISVKTSTPFVDNSNSPSEEDNYILAQATKEAGEVSDDERTTPNEISIDDYLSLYNGDADALVLISRPTCQYCKIATPILENIIYESNVSINYLNADNLSEDDNKTLLASDEYLENGYGTPLLLVVGNGQIKDKVEGLTTKENYQEFFKNYGFME